MTEGLPQRYRLLRRIGVGGMAEVFRAELVSAEGITRDIVIKRVHPRLALDPEATRRFVDEARVAARLRHPNVVQVYEFGRAGDHYFLAMELVDGCDLAALLRGADGGRLPPPVALAVVDALLDALAYVHALRGPDGGAMGLVHRDVSPHNVLLGHAGEIKLADFGIAQASRGDVEAGAVEGKLAYMAPEQSRGERVDARADLFAAAAILHQMFTGRRVYGDASGDGLRARAARGAVDPFMEDAAMEPLRAVLRRALAAEAAERYPDAPALREALHAAADALGLRADPAALRALIARTAANEPPAAALSERTLTDGVAPAEPPPAPPRARRVFFERAAIAVGVLVVSVLAERRTRPTARPVAAPRPSIAAGQPLRVGLPAGVAAAWWGGPVRRLLEEGVGARVERVDLGGPAAAARALRAGDVDLALVPSEALRALVTADAVRRLDTVLPEIDGGSYLALRNTLRAEALRWGASVGPEGEGTYALPAAADLVAFGVRDVAVRRAVERAVEQRPALDAWLRSRGRLRLPSGAGVRRDPDSWTSWDLLLASWCWSREGQHVAAAPPDDGAGVAATLARWGSLGAPVDGAIAAPDALAASDAAMGLLTAMGATSPAASDDASVVARWAPLSWWARHGGDGWSLVRPPRGDGLALDALGDPVGEGQRAIVGRTWGWCLARGSSRTARAARLLLLAARASSNEALVRELGGTDATARVTPLGGPTGAFIRAALEQSPFVRLEGPASVAEAESLTTRVRALVLAGH